ncbi:MAG: hypothetical protein HY541_05150 [Deltaproteobacteria bacterium]|nr:hypothetical protein [Deltaproteobacteria bacterium]
MELCEWRHNEMPKGAEFSLREGELWGFAILNRVPPAEGTSAGGISGGDS